MSTVKNELWQLCATVLETSHLYGFAVRDYRLLLFYLDPIGRDM